MHVAIEHREDAGGVTGARRRYFIDCTVRFSEEERAIIKARDLYRHDIVVRPDTLLPSQAASVGTAFMRSGGCLLAIVAVVLGFVSAFTHSGEGLSYLLLAGGIGLVIYSWRRGRRQDKRLETPEQVIKLSQLLSDPRFTVHAFDPAHAKSVEEEIRAQLVALKGLLTGSAELRSKQTFEL